MKIINLGNRTANSWLYPIQDGYVLVDTGYERAYSSFLKKLKQNSFGAKIRKNIFLPGMILLY